MRSYIAFLHHYQGGAVQYNIFQAEGDMEAWEEARVWAGAVLPHFQTEQIILYPLGKPIARVNSRYNVRTSVSELGMPGKGVNALIRAGYKTLGDCARQDEAKFKKWTKNFGARSYGILKQRMLEAGLKFRDASV